MEYRLQRGEVIRLDAGKERAALRCLKGALWLTTGDGRDYLLTAGRSLALPGGRTVVAEALQTAECAVVSSPARLDARNPVVRLAAC